MTFLLFPSIILAITPMFYLVFQLTATTAEPQMPSPSPLDDINGHFLGPSLLVNKFEPHEESCTAEEVSIWSHFE
ncbi:hypothetical protein Hypma_005861 [Hypsizygus marmoreus]|uniref:Uncharacterized protein n=1 Tax=Hypsizygus marmoreus TaxID=39966 RepID=A0A369KG74_HYPMA|nr:hypothetical protein Hypma_005861 [Hypsizygus marmoreus]